MSAHLINLECRDEVITSSRSSSKEFGSAVEEKYLYPHNALDKEAIHFQVSPSGMKEIPFPEIEYIRPGCIVLTYFTKSSQSMVDDHFFRSLKGINLKKKECAVSKRGKQASETLLSKVLSTSSHQLSIPSKEMDSGSCQHNSSCKHPDSLKEESFENPDFFPGKFAICEGTDAQEVGGLSINKQLSEDLSFEHLLQYFSNNSPNTEMFEPPTDDSQSNFIIPFSEVDSNHYSNFDTSFYRGATSAAACTSDFDERTGNAAPIGEHRSFWFRPSDSSTPSNIVATSDDDDIAINEMEFIE